MMGVFLRDSRSLLLLAAIASLLMSFAKPTLSVVRNGFDMLAVIDITGSMNTRDYHLGDVATSRLDFAKRAMRVLIKQLPCPSRLALGVFSERQPFLLFEPINICTNFAPVDGAVDALDWRMAWEGDSHVAAGLFRAIEMARDLNVDLLFITDGQEAPPLPWSGGPKFDGRPGAVRGVIVGVGDYVLSPIPKFDEKGREIGFVGASDVPHENRGGLPPPDAEKREGYNPRNAPFGGAAVVGEEHLSSVREAYLKQLASVTGLAYRHLERIDDLKSAITLAGAPRSSMGPLDLRGWLSGAAFAGLAILYLAIPLQTKFRLRRERSRFDYPPPMRRGK